MESLRFFAQTVRRFRSTGALIPSSPRLARAMVAEIQPLEADAVIVELGPGTGVFTRELLHRFPHHRIVAVEANTAFAQRLARQLPAIEIITGCASEVPQHLSRLGIDCRRVGAVVSGLPLLSLPRPLCNSIFASIATTLSPGRRYVQFTYSKRLWRSHTPPGFRLDRTNRVWLNLPPAAVLPFTRISA